MALKIPKELAEFEELYDSEEKCLSALIRQKWPEGYKCSRCGERRGNAFPQRRLVECVGCGNHESPLSHTMFENCRVPLTNAFRMLRDLAVETSPAERAELASRLAMALNGGKGKISGDDDCCINREQGWALNPKRDERQE